MQSSGGKQLPQRDGVRGALRAAINLIWGTFAHCFSGGWARFGHCFPGAKVNFGHCFPGANATLGHSFSGGYETFVIIPLEVV